MQTQKIWAIHQGSLLNWKGKDRVRRFSRFCLEHVKLPHGHTAGHRYELADVQRDWMRSVIFAMVVCIVIGRGNGKSTWAAALALWWAVDPPEGDLRPEIVIVAASKDQAKGGVFDTCRWMVENDPWLSSVSHYYSDQANPRIEFTNGAIIRVRSAHPKRLQGMIASLILLDEVGAVEEQVWTTLVQGLGKRPGSTLVAIGTPMWEHGVLHDLVARHHAGQLDAYIAMHEHAAPPECGPDDRKGWRAANPIRYSTNPDVETTLRMIRNTVSEADWCLFQLCQWPDLSGKPVVSAERWAELEGLTVGTDDWEHVGHHVAVDGDWKRHNLAIVGSCRDDDMINLSIMDAWQDWPEEVPAGDIVAGVLRYGIPHTVTLGRSLQGTGIAEQLEAEGIVVEELNTSGAAAMREPTDAFLSGITDGTIRHDGHEELTSSVLAARQDVRRDGVVFIRDDRLETRIDGLTAAAVAGHAARTEAVIAIW